MRRHLLSLLLMGIVATFVLPASPSSAGQCVHLHRIVYDSPGSDTGTNESLNAEFVTVHNVCRLQVNLNGWKLRDQTGTEYLFKFSIRGHSTVKVHSGRGANTPRDKFWKLDRYVWDNSKDIATLLRPKANGGFKVASRCSYFDEPEKASATLC